MAKTSLLQISLIEVEHCEQAGEGRLTSALGFPVEENLCLENINSNFLYRQLDYL